jgi:hypothetical protein
MSTDTVPGNDDGPSLAELAAIEAEWSRIAAELDVVNAEVRLAVAGPSATELDWRRLRRAEARVLRIVRSLTSPVSRSASDRRSAA